MDKKSGKFVVTTRMEVQQADALKRACRAICVSQNEFVLLAVRFAVCNTARGGNMMRLEALGEDLSHNWPLCQEMAAVPSVGDPEALVG